MRFIIVITFCVIPLFGEFNVKNNTLHEDNNNQTYKYKSEYFTPIIKSNDIENIKHNTHPNNKIFNSTFSNISLQNAAKHIMIEPTRNYFKKNKNRYAISFNHI